jgi:hypothetical protein
MKRVACFLLIISFLPGCLRTVPRQVWLAGFKCRIPLYLTLPTGASSDLHDYQIRLDLQGIDSKLPFYIDFTLIKHDGTDIRFTDTNSITQLSYWIQSWDNDNTRAVVWVKVPEIKTDQPKTIYLYYANPGVKNGSSFTQTMTKLMPDETTIALWHFDESKGQVRDASAHRNHSVSLKAQRLGRDGCWGHLVQSKIGNALVFNGQDSYVKIPASASLSFKGLDKLSIEAWIYPVSYQAHATILTKEGEYYLQVNESGKLACYLYGPKPEQYYYSNDSIPLNQWSYIALTFDGRFIRFYINGTLNTTIESKGVIQPCLDRVHAIDYEKSVLWIGNDLSQTDRAWSGMLDEIRLIRRTLTPEEIKTDNEYRKYSPVEVTIRLGAPEK